MKCSNSKWTISGLLNIKISTVVNSLPQASMPSIRQCDEVQHDFILPAYKQSEKVFYVIYI